MLHYGAAVSPNANENDIVLAGHNNNEITRGALRGPHPLWRLSGPAALGDHTPAPPPARHDLSTHDE